MSPLWLPVAILVTLVRLAFLLALEIPVVLVMLVRRLLGMEVERDV